MMVCYEFIRQGQNNLKESILDFLSSMANDSMFPSLFLLHAPQIIFVDILTVIRPYICYRDETVSGRRFSGQWLLNFCIPSSSELPGPSLRVHCSCILAGTEPEQSFCAQERAIDLSAGPWGQALLESWRRCSVTPCLKSFWDSHKTTPLPFSFSKR